MNVPQFLAWAESQDKGRHELIRGEVVTLPRECVAHVRAKMRAAAALDVAIQLRGVGCKAFVSGLGVMIDDETCYDPDALVSCSESYDPDTMIAPNPVIVVEVISPTIRDLNKSFKVADYFRIPSLAHCLLVDLERHQVVNYRRLSGSGFTSDLVRQGALVLEPPGIEVAAESLLV